MRSRLLFVGLLLGCNATAAQVSTTFTDGAKVGACIIGAALGGTDPVSCAGATEQLIADVIEDFESKNTPDGQAPDARLEAAKAKAKARLVK